MEEAKEEINIFLWRKRFLILSQAIESEGKHSDVFSVLSPVQPSGFAWVNTLIVRVKTMCRQIIAGNFRPGTTGRRDWSRNGVDI